jgi:hypothetical protein
LKRLSTKQPLFVDNKHLPPELRMLYFVSVRSGWPNSDWGDKLRRELAIDRLQQDPQRFQQVTRRLLEEGLVVPKGSVMLTSGKASLMTTLDQVGMVKNAEYLEPTAKGKKLLQYVVTSRRNSILCIVGGVVGLGLLVSALALFFLSSITLVTALLDSLDASIFLAWGLAGVWTISRRRKLIARFAEVQYR